MRQPDAEQDKRLSAPKSIVNKTNEYLEKILASDPLVESIELEFMQLSDIRPFIDILSSFGKLKKLSLHGNRIKELPLEMKRLEELEELDISNNMIRDEMIIVLRDIPNLKRLITSFKGPDEEAIKQGLSNLQFYNNSKIERQRKPTQIKRINKYQLKNEHLQKAAKMFDKIRAIYKKSYAKNNDKQNRLQFEDDTQETLRNMQMNINDNRHSPDHVLSGIYLTSRYALYKVIQNKLTNLVTDIEPEYGKLLLELFDDYSLLITYFAEVALAKPALAQPVAKNSKQNQVQALEKELRRVRRQKDQLLAQIASLEVENKNYIDALVRSAKGQKISVINNNYRTSRDIQSSPRKSQGTERQKVRTSPKEYALSVNNGKAVTLKQLKDMIAEIQDSKVKFDQKVFDSKQPRQTMYQYLFTFLNQKYGLKTLTIEWASSIVSGIQKYSAEDNDVAVFGKILRNECEEEFRDVQAEAKAAVAQLLKLHIKTHVKSVHQNEMSGSISSEEAENIIQYFYNQADANEVIEKLNVLYTIQQKQDKKLTREDSMYNQEKKTIRYSTFLKCILDLQLRSHQKYLKPLTQIFHSLDTDNDGVINQKQFSDLLQEMCQDADKHLSGFLNLVDPYQTGMITYSQVVKLFSNYPEGNPILSRYAETQK